MNTSEELAGISLTALKDLTAKGMEVLSEIIKALILKTTQDTDKARPGQNKIEKLLTGGNRLNAPIKLDKEDVNKFYKLASDHHIPVSVIKSGSEYRAFFRESDLGMVSHIMQDILVQKMGVDKDKQKEITLNDKVEAQKFKHRAQKENVPCTFFDTEDGKVKVCFYENDIDKVKSIIGDLKAAQEKHSKRLFSLEKAKDSVASFITQEDTLRLYDADLGSSIKLKLPITKKAFIKNVKAAFGYTHKEALDLAARIESGKSFDGYVTPKFMGDIKWQWKPDYKKMYSQVDKFEKDIKVSKESDTLKDYSFSMLTLADSNNTKMLTVSEKEGTKSYSTQAVDSVTFVKDVMERLGVNETVAKDMSVKAGKLGFITDNREILSDKAIDNQKPSLPIIDASKNGLEKYGFSVREEYYDDGYYNGTHLIFNKAGKDYKFKGFVYEAEGTLQEYLQAIGFNNEQIKELQNDKFIGKYLHDVSTSIDIPASSKNAELSTNKPASIKVNTGVEAIRLTPSLLVDKEFNRMVEPLGNHSAIVDKQNPKNYIIVDRNIEEVSHEAFGVVDHAYVYSKGKLIKSYNNIDKTGISQLKDIVNTYKEPVVMNNEELKSLHEAPTFESYEIRKSAANHTVTFTYNGKSLKADLSNKDATITGLTSTFNLSAKDAASLFDKAEKQGVAEAVKSAKHKASVNTTKTKVKEKTLSKDNGAR